MADSMAPTTLPVVAPDLVFADPALAALAEAVAVGDRDRIRALAPGVDLSARGDQDVTFLQWALLNGSLAGLDALLDAGADPAQPGIDGDTVVHLAAMARDPAFLDALLARGADPNVRNARTGAGPLSAAMMGDRERQFDALLAAGATPWMADGVGNTPLHVAGLIDAPGRALRLLAAGADPMARNAQGATFQRYLFMGRIELLTEEASRGWEAVLDWMEAHRVPLELAAA
jgi:hypothetical protein